MENNLGAKSRAGPAAGATSPHGGHPAPRSPAMPPLGAPRGWGPQPRGHPSAKAPAASVQPDTGARYRGHPSGTPIGDPAPLGQMGSGGPGCPLPPPSCHLGQGGEGLSALARVPISAISMGWGQGAAGRPASPTPARHRHAMPGCAGSSGQRHGGHPGSSTALPQPEKSRLCRLAGLCCRSAARRGGTCCGTAGSTWHTPVPTCVAAPGATWMSLPRALCSPHISAGACHLMPATMQCLVRRGARCRGARVAVRGGVGVPGGCRNPRHAQQLGSPSAGDAMGLTSGQPTPCHRGPAWCPLPVHAGSGSGCGTGRPSLGLLRPGRAGSRPRRGSVAQGSHHPSEGTWPWGQ